MWRRGHPLRTAVPRHIAQAPSIRTIGRILERRGALDGRHRVRRPPPPLGWYLPEVAQGACELDSVDIVEGLVIEGDIHVEVLNTVSLHGGLVASWPSSGITAKLAADALVAHWRAWGVPGYAQFDNDTRFQGAHQHKDVIGRVMRVCLSLHVIPVFVPPRETGFQAAIEGLNGRWQAKVWARFHHESLPVLQARSADYVVAYHRRAAARIEAAPTRQPFPQTWQLDLQAPPQGRIIFLRRTTERGHVELLGHHFAVDPHWSHRLVRAEVDLTAGVISFYALRRREPTSQPLLQTVPYQLPRRRFRE